MTYDFWNERTDFKQINDLCNKHNIAFPDTSGIIYVAKDDNGKIVGFIAAKQQLYIEPFICENPLAANKLYRQMEKILALTKKNVVRCICDKSKEKLFAKVGFRTIEDNKIIMEKE